MELGHLIVITLALTIGCKQVTEKTLQKTAPLPKSQEPGVQDHAGPAHLTSEEQNAGQPPMGLLALRVYAPSGYGPHLQATLNRNQRLGDVTSLLSPSELIESGNGVDESSKSALISPATRNDKAVGFSAPDEMLLYLKRIELIPAFNFAVKTPVNPRESPTARDPAATMGAKFETNIDDIKKNNVDGSTLPLMLNESSRDELARALGLSQNEGALASLRELVGVAFSGPDAFLKRVVEISGATEVQVQNAMVPLMEGLADEASRFIFDEPDSPKNFILFNNPQGRPIKISHGVGDLASIAEDSSNLVGGELSPDDQGVIFKVPVGIYSGIRLIWAGKAEVKGCVPRAQSSGKNAKNSDQNLFYCTQRESSPYVAGTYSEDFAEKESTLMEMPLLSGFAGWPVAEDIELQSQVELDVSANKVAQINVVHHLTSLLRFHEFARSDHDSNSPSAKGAGLVASRLLAGGRTQNSVMPQSKAYFYIASFLNQTLVTSRSVGRFYGFEGVALMCSDGQIDRGTRLCPNGSRPNLRQSLSVSMVSDTQGSPLFMGIGSASSDEAKLMGSSREYQICGSKTFDDHWIEEAEWPGRARLLFANCAPHDMMGPGYGDEMIDLGVIDGMPVMLDQVPLATVGHGAPDALEMFLSWTGEVADSDFDFDRQSRSGVLQLVRRY